MPKPTRATTSKTKTQRSTPYQLGNTSTTMATVSAADSLPTPASGEAQSKPWIPDDDAILLHARQQGLNWGPIAERFFPSKTANACRKRHERLVIKNNSTGDWDSAKTEALARLYMEFREQMWKILAAKLDEKWETVEGKCMEKGLKTLRSHGRSATRKQKSSNQGDNDDDNIDDFIDSGLGPDLNPGDDISNDAHIGYARVGHHDQQHAYPSVHSGPFSSSGGRSSAPSYGTASVASSHGNTPHPQQHQRSSPETLPSIASILKSTPDSRF